MTLKVSYLFGELLIIITVHILRIIFNNKNPIYCEKYFKYMGQSIFNNDKEILQPTLTRQHSKPFVSARILKFMQEMSQNENIPKECTCHLT